MNILLIDFVQHTLPKTVLKLSNAFKDYHKSIVLIRLKLAYAVILD